MDPTHAVDDNFTTASAEACPINLVREVMDSFAEASRAMTAGLGDPASGLTSFGRTMSSVIQANGVLLEQLSGVASRFDPTRAAGSAASFRARPFRSGPAPAPAPAPEAQNVLLAGLAGTEVVGAFALENMRSEPILATVLATTFVDLAGDPVPVDLRLDPAKVVIGPGDEVIVKVIATVPVGMAPGEQLHGAIHVPGLTTSMVPVVLRSA